MINEFLRLLFLNQFIKEASLLTERYVQYRDLQYAIGFIQLKCVMRWKVLRRKYRGIGEKFRNQIRSVLTFTSIFTIKTDHYIPRAKDSIFKFFNYYLQREYYLEK